MPACSAERGMAQGPALLGELHPDDSISICIFSVPTHLVEIKA